MPDHVIYKPCGNRRATTCPGCAETYRRDAYHLIRAGLIGGKGITPEVATHPAVFATFTAPSFGSVHSRPVRQHTCADKTRCTCRPEPCHARRHPGTCEHGRLEACFTRHRPDDPGLGQPLCADCYDYPAHVVWNNAAANCGGALSKLSNAASASSPASAASPRSASPPGTAGPGWSFRSVSPTAKPPNTRPAARSTSTPCSASTATTPADPDPLLPPPSVITVADLDDATGGRPKPSATAPRPHPAGPGGWPITWGTEIDIRVITLTGTGDLTDLAVASYLAKYSTKGTEPAGHASARITVDTLDLYARPDGTHPERLIHACWSIGNHPDYTSLRRWAHMLGFGGHFLTKARRYSITFRDLRQARITYRRSQDTGPEHGPIRTADYADEETTLIIGTFTYAGTGWKTSGDALLANTAADQARKRREAGRDQLADEYAETIASEAA